MKNRKFYDKQTRAPILTRTFTHDLRSAVWSRPIFGKEYAFDKAVCGLPVSSALSGELWPEPAGHSGDSSPNQR